jgi:replicative DNA helicase
MTTDQWYSPLLGLSQRLPPSNVQAEQALLGALMANNGAFARIADFLRKEHFADPIHGRVFEAIEQRILEGRLADAVTIKQDFENTGVLEEVGGTQYLAQLLGAMVGIISAGEYGRTIHDTWLRRELIAVGESIVNNAFGADSALSGVQQIEWAERALADIRVDGARRDRLMTLGEAVSAAIRQSERAYKDGVSPALLTGFATFDRGSGGLWPGDFSLLGGLPGAGKTALAVQVGCSIAERRYAAAIAQGATQEEALRQPGVAIFELEMSAEELGARVTAARASVSVERLRRGELDIALAEKLLFVERSVAGLPLRIHDCTATSMRLLGAKVRMHLRRQPEVCVIVDHLLVADTDNDRRGGTGHDANSVSKAAREIKQVARDTGLPFLVLTHVGRSTRARPNPRPTMSDVKWGGEGDADNVFFVHRPIMFMSNDPPAKERRWTDEQYAQARLNWMNERDRAATLAELVVDKRRMGPTGVYKMHFDGPTTTFSEWITP